MEFVEINANRQPRLSGGRRGASTLQPGGNAVSNNLVPVSSLPASAGNLDAVFKDINMKKITKKSGGAYVMRDGKAVGVGSDSDTFRRRHGGAMVMNPDGTTTGVGSDDMSWKRIGKGRPKKANVASGLFHHTIIPEGGRMSKLVPRHGHGASTSIGTNYQLGQFGGSMTQPIGNTASTLSPALSGMSVGGKRYATGLAKLTPEEMKKYINKWMTGGYSTGLGKITPEQIQKMLKNASIKKAVRFFGSALNHVRHGGRRPIGADPKTWTPIAKLKGGDLLGDIFGVLKDVGMDILKEVGPEFLNIGKDLLKDELKSGLKGLFSSGAGRPGADGHGIYSGGDFGSDFLGGLKSVVDNDFVKGFLKEIGGELLNLGKDMLKDELKSGMKSGLKGLFSGGDAPLGTPQSLQQVYSGSGLRPGQYNLYRGKKTGGAAGMDDFHYLHGPAVVGSNPIYDDNLAKKIDELILQYPELKNMFKTGKGRRVRNPKYKGDNFGIPKGEMDGLNGYGRPGADGHGIRKIGGKKPNARGAIVSRIMKEKGLTLPMASKYVKEHGLY